MKNIIAVGANYHSRLLARQFGITMVRLQEILMLIICIFFLKKQKGFMINFFISFTFHFHSVLRVIDSQVDPNGVNKIDIAFDGVDEVDFNKNLLKVGMLCAFDLSSQICIRILKLLLYLYVLLYFPACGNYLYNAKGMLEHLTDYLNGAVSS